MTDSSIFMVYREAEMSDTERRRRLASVYRRLIQLARENSSSLRSRLEEEGSSDQDEAPR